MIIGSQAIHGEIVDPPDELLQSMEVDMYPRLAWRWAWSRSHSRAHLAPDRDEAEGGDQGR